MAVDFEPQTSGVHVGGESVLLRREKCVYRRLVRSRSNQTIMTCEGRQIIQCQAHRWNQQLVAIVRISVTALLSTLLFLSLYTVHGIDVYRTVEGFEKRCFLRVQFGGVFS